VALISIIKIFQAICLNSSRFSHLTKNKCSLKPISRALFVYEINRSAPTHKINSETTWTIHLRNWRLCIEKFMGTVTKNKGGFSSPSTCNRNHLVGALGIAVLTFFATRLLDQAVGPCNIQSRSHESRSNAENRQYGGTLQDVFGKSSAGWPEQGYGFQLSLKIYVYEEWEVDGLKELLRGRDHSVASDSCEKGQWGTQVILHVIIIILNEMLTLKAIHALQVAESLKPLHRPSFLT
jgi:hypothetical protein